jgi:hypothetical protein
MRLAGVVFAIAVCASGLAQSAQGAAGEGAAGDLIAKSKAIPQALKTKDVNTLNQLLAGDFKQITSAGRAEDRGELVSEAGEGSLRDFTIYNPEFIVIDDNSAIVTYNLIVTMPEGDDQWAPRYQKISDLWVRSGNEWRLKFEQATPLRPVD